MSNRFKVTEWFSGYELEDTVTGLTAWLGDGVDVFTVELEEPNEDGAWEEALWSGTPEVLKAYNELYNNDMSVDEVFEAYWPDYQEVK